MFFEIANRNGEIEYNIYWDAKKEGFLEVYLHCQNVPGTGILSLSSEEFSVNSERISQKKRILPSLNSFYKPLDMKLGNGIFEFSLYKDEALTQKACDKTITINNCPEIKFSFYTQKTKELGFSYLYCKCKYRIPQYLWNIRIKETQKPLFQMPIMEKIGDFYQSSCPIFDKAFENLEPAFDPLIKDFITVKKH